MWTKLEVIKLKNTGELKGGLSSRMTEPRNASLCLRIRNDTIIKEQKEEKRIKKNEENTSDLWITRGITHRHSGRGKRMDEELLL